MTDSIAQAKEWVAQYQGEQFTFVGHSKGGGEAIANAVATGYNAIAFNPATPRLCEYGLPISGHRGSIDNYIVGGEILHSVMNLAANVVSPGLKRQGMLSAAISHLSAGDQFFKLVALLCFKSGHSLELTPVGNVHYLPESASETIKSANILERHDIEVVIDGLEEIIYKPIAL